MPDEIDNTSPSYTAGYPRPYQICVRCVMDTSDPAISFDELGLCNHCRNFESLSRQAWIRGEEGRKRLFDHANTIKRDGTSKEYDIVIGVSGGVDSSYLLHLCKVELGLRPIAVHVDAGWNSELAVSNIEKLVTRLGIDLYTHVVDWEEMRDLQLAYLRSGLANQDVPQDHVFAAEVLRTARRIGIHHIANGSNLATESILPTSWGYDASDATQLKAVHRKFGALPLRQYRPMPFWMKRIYFPLIYGIKVFYPLNYIHYNKKDAMALLTERYEWVYYGGKHFESRWTRFFQSYFLPRRFGFDKRRAHLASLVVASEITRDEALRELETPPYEPQEIENDIEYVCRKLRISQSEFESLIQQPLRNYSDYPNDESLTKRLRALNATRHSLLTSNSDRLRKASVPGH